MIPTRLRNAWRRQEPEPDLDVIETSGPDADATHDLVLRYCIIGIFIILATASLSLARPVALPIVAGLIFGLVLGPSVDRMVRMGLPQQLSAGILVLSGVVVMLTVIGIFAAPFAIWSDRLPGIIAALRDRLADLTALAKRLEGLAGASLEQGAAAPPVPVTVTESTSPLINIALTSTSAAGGILIFIATIYFYLATRRHLKARALRLCLGGHARRSAGAFFELLEAKIASYFGVVTIINFGMGVATAAIAWMAGLPFPLFWGLVAMILNYIVFIGPGIMAALLFGAGLIGESSSFSALWPALAYLFVNLIEGNFLTPLLVGRRLTVNPFLVFVSFVFWLWLWGPVGAILSTPLLLVIGLSIEAIRDHKRHEAEAEAQARTEAEAANREAERIAREEAQRQPIGIVENAGQTAIAAI